MERDATQSIAAPRSYSTSNDSSSIIFQGTRTLETPSANRQQCPRYGRQIVSPIPHREKPLSASIALTTKFKQAETFQRRVPLLKVPYRPAKESATVTVSIASSTCDENGLPRYLPSDQLDGQSELDEYHSSAGHHGKQERSSASLRRKLMRTAMVRRLDCEVPDRFISPGPSQLKTQSSVESFKVNLPPEQLTANERSLRHGSASPDPFGPLFAPRLRVPRISGAVGATDLLRTRTSARMITPTSVSDSQQPNLGPMPRSVSVGAIWNVGGSIHANFPPSVRRVSDGRGGFIQSGTNAPMYTSHFLNNMQTEAGHFLRMERRLAAALELDQTSRIFHRNKLPTPEGSVTRHKGVLRSRDTPLEQHHKWEDGAWSRESGLELTKACRPKPEDPIPVNPFRYVSSSIMDIRMLDAPELCNDFYYSVLAYCYSIKILAAGLGDQVFLWSEEGGVRCLENEHHELDRGQVTSLAFSSTEGGHSILATGRNNGEVTLRSLRDQHGASRFRLRHPKKVCTVSWKPVTTRRQSWRFTSDVPTEELLIGDIVGIVYYYAVEWPNPIQKDIHGWNGHVQLLAKIVVHSQQVCGIQWSQNGNFFATGSNDNFCYLFEPKCLLDIPSNTKVEAPANKGRIQTLLDSLSFTGRASLDSTRSFPRLPTTRGRSRASSSPFPSFANYLLQSRAVTYEGTGCMIVSQGREKYRWLHNAAVKAMAFCPWQKALLATGGGSNDRAIHFYHTYSGACLATIDVHAQVTSLIWSTTKREIAATLGYPQPNHPYRIAVFSWPDCKQVVAIPYNSNLRALYAIPFPGGPSECDGENGRVTTAERKKRTAMGETWFSRTAQEGCIVVACSDASIKFHEIWAGKAKNDGCKDARGTLGGSVILEELEGISSWKAEVIR